MMAGRWCSFTRILTLLAFLYLGYNLHTVYKIFNPASCLPSQKLNCLTPLHDNNQKLQLWVYVSTVKSSLSSKAKLLYHNKSFTRNQEIKESLNVTIPASTLKNGSLYAHVFLGPVGKAPTNQQDRVHLSSSTVPLTRYSVPEVTAFNLLSDEEESEQASRELPVSHWIPFLNVHSVGEDWHFDRYQVPQELLRMIRMKQNTYSYLPILYVDELKVMTKHLEPLSANMTLDLTYSPVSIGKLRLWLIFANAMQSMSSLGFSEKEFDDLKGIFLNTDLWLFSLTIFISVFHLLFDFLAFKNDVSFWRHKKTMVGLSTRTIVWRCFSQFVIFLYLMDRETSLLVLIPVGIGTVIEVWKVTKAFKITITWKGLLPKIHRAEKQESEKETESLDSEAMHKLSYLLYPLVLAGAVYQLLYSSYKSWYSWLIQSLVNGVYAFGFLFMLPQLFLNYKLKSVAHLPWRAFMYKAFNTFIDDVFAFIITMPTSHRIAVFRDDVVFLVYLYQRWLYPVDRSRVNEYGEAFETPEQSTGHEKED